VDAWTWVVLADAATAKLYQPQASGRDWQLISELTHPQSRAKESELGTDKPGRVKQSTGSRAAMERPTPRKRVEVEKFARQIAKTLDDALVRNAYDRLVLVAPAEFVGVLRRVLPERVEARIAATVEKDYLHLDAPTARERLEQQLEAK
jgi:protein required for attachment to host cells